MKKSFSFPIFSSIQKINLPFTIDNCFAIRINQIMFNFNSFNNKVLLISFQSLDSNTYFDGVSSHHYTFIYFNDGSKSTINYLNKISSYDSTFNSKNLISLEIKVEIDNELNNIISNENPLYISIDFYSNH